MCHWHWHFTDFFLFAKFTFMRLLNEVVRGLPSCATGTGISLKIFFWQNSLMRLLIEVDCLTLGAIGTGISLTFFLQKFTLMRLFIEVDCLYVPLALAFHWFPNEVDCLYVPLTLAFDWKYFLTKFSLMRLFEVDCLYVPLALTFDYIFLQNAHSWCFSFCWITVMCFWRLQ